MTRPAEMTHRGRERLIGADRQVVDARPAQGLDRRARVAPALEGMRHEARPRLRLARALEPARAPPGCAAPSRPPWTPTCRARASRRAAWAPRTPSRARGRCAP